MYITSQHKTLITKKLDKNRVGCVYKITTLNKKIQKYI